MSHEDYARFEEIPTTMHQKSIEKEIKEVFLGGLNADYIIEKAKFNLSNFRNLTSNHDSSLANAAPQNFVDASTGVPLLIQIIQTIHW